MDKYLKIDDEGFISLDGIRVEDEKSGQQLLKNLKRLEKDRFVTNWDGVEAMVEAFDEPLIAKHVERSGSTWKIITPYHLELPFSLEDLCVDDYDRFHGLTGEKIPFVFSRSAQFEFFDLVDAFDDESVTVDGKTFAIPPYYIPLPEIKDEKFWTNIYKTETPGWEMGHAAQPLNDILPQLKIPKSRVLVLGSGTGHDAAFFAQAGHLVTAVDFSAEAAERARLAHSSTPNLEFVQADIFALNYQGAFDVIFEHACYPAIPPERRAELIKLWKRFLAPGGHLLGVFFMMSKRGGPPFGNSEWELRERLKKDFRFLYWTRWRHSIERRKGRELVVYAQKL